MKLIISMENFLLNYRARCSPVKEKLASTISAFFAIWLLVYAVQHIPHDVSFRLAVVASMGATAFLLFVTPHSPMAQPWPVIGGHLIASIIGVICAKWIDSPAFATAIAVSLSIFMMHWLQCLHPPSAATAMIAVLGGAEVHAMGWQFCYEVVAINTGLIIVLSLIINNLIPGRQYPLLHHHHPHHFQLSKSGHKEFIELNEEDFKWALSQMDAYIDVSEEDLVDLYEFAAEHALQRMSSPQPAK